jgi:hypothetical protein
MRAESSSTLQTMHGEFSTLLRALHEPVRGITTVHREFLDAHRTAVDAARRGDAEVLAQLVAAHRASLNAITGSHMIAAEQLAEATRYMSSSATAIASGARTLADATNASGLSDIRAHIAELRRFFCGTKS